MAYPKVILGKKSTGLWRMQAWFNRICFQILVRSSSKKSYLEPYLEDRVGALKLNRGLRNLARGVPNRMSFGTGGAMGGSFQRHAAQSTWERSRRAEAGQNDGSGEDNSQSHSEALPLRLSQCL